jgi:hypothetical protein
MALLTAFRPTYHSRPNGQRIGNQIDTAMIFAGPDFVSML